MPVWVWILVVVLAGAAAWRLGNAWWRYRGQRVIICPENVRPAGVKVDAVLAAKSSLGGASELRLSSCSRWPERAGCGQECLSQIKASPEDCLMRNIVTRWLVGKRCANCGSTFHEISWSDRPPALLGADKTTVEWSRVPAERIFETLDASVPVCFACHTAITMVREHPELVVHRNRT